MSELKKNLNVSGLTMIAIGACIGSGIFLTPSDSFQALPHHGYVLLAWFIGGLITFFGAMTFSELSSRFSQAGGVYVFLREAYGDLVGFLYGWIILLIVNTGALAALSVAFVEYLGFFIELSAQTKKVLSVSTILILTAVNILGVNISQLFAQLFTSLKMIALLAIVALGVWFAGSSGESQELNLNLLDVPEGVVSATLLAFVGVFWSFGGWHHATYLAGETKKPKKTVPRAMLLGTMTVTLIYLMVIFAMSLMLPISEISSSERLAGDAVGAVISGGGKLVALAITISIFGTIGIYTMSAPRIYYAMAKDGIFFNWLTKLHPAYKTPYYAMLFQAIWACFLVLIWGKFSRLITFVTFMDIVFMALATASIFIFRRRGNTKEPEFKLKLYPIIPAIYLLVTAAFVYNTLIELRYESIAGLLILVIGIPVFYFFKREKEK